MQHSDGANQANWNPEKTVKISTLWPYCGNNAGIFRCPADSKYPCRSRSGQRRVYPRVRSMSMLSWFNGCGCGRIQRPPGYVVYSENDGRCETRAGDDLCLPGRTGGQHQRWRVVYQHVRVGPVSAQRPGTLLIFRPITMAAQADLPLPMATRKFINGGTWH